MNQTVLLEKPPTKTRKAKPVSEVSIDLWERFFTEALRERTEFNPELRRDIALDKTIRALGQKPGFSPVPIGCWGGGRCPNYGNLDDEMWFQRRRAREEHFEDWCDAALEESA